MDCLTKNVIFEYNAMHTEYIAGNTVYVHGLGVTEEILRKTFSNFGTIVNISMEKERK